MKIRLVIVGGSDAGISAALRAREVAPGIEPLLILADEYPNFSICGIPFYLSGEVRDWQHLAHRSRSELEQAGLQLLPQAHATSVNPQNRRVSICRNTGEEQEIPYDRLVIGTGAVSNRPPLPGIELPGVFTLRWMREARAVQTWLESRKPRRALLVGGGYINMEMCDALSRAGLEVSLVEHHATVLKTVDQEFGRRIRNRLEEAGVSVHCGRRVAAFGRTGSASVTARLDDGTEIDSDLVIVATGARPATALAETAGAPTGRSGALRVSRAMETGVNGVYAAGDCVETYHSLLKKPVYLPLGSTSHKQGRVAGENAAGGEATYAGTVGTQVVRVFDLVAARTGLHDRDAIQYGLHPLTVETTTWDHKVYYPDAREVVIRLTGDAVSGRLLGAQILGVTATEAAKRIDTFATALQSEKSVRDLLDLDLSYTPPLGSPWDPIHQAAMEWVREWDSLEHRTARPPSDSETADPLAV